MELYELSAESFARFVSRIPFPLGLGKLELEDGRIVPGFIGEAVAAGQGRDISDLADWKRYSPPPKTGPEDPPR